MRHLERHRTARIGWFGAAVLGANDGIMSTTSLVSGVAAAGVDQRSLLPTGAAGLIAGVLSMAAGEYVLVFSQADTEKADLTQVCEELALNTAAELRKLTAIYVQRGLGKTLALQIATQSTARDALANHARDELGIFETFSAQPVQAARASAASIPVGEALPLAVIVMGPAQNLIAWVPVTSLLFLAALGSVAARVGGAPVGQTHGGKLSGSVGDGHHGWRLGVVCGRFLNNRAFAWLVSAFALSITTKMTSFKVVVGPWPRTRCLFHCQA